MSSNFFASRSDRSRVKSLVVGRYYRQWGHIIANAGGPGSGAMGYVDMFCGPGVYDDGTESTPLIVVRETLRAPTLRSRVQLVFNDENKRYVETLQNIAEVVVGGEQVGLGRIPMYSSFEVGPESLDWFRELRLGSCLLFLDPWGYRGLSLDLISGLVKGWGSDCIFLFNYAALHRHLFNEGEDQLVAEFWNAEDLDGLKALLSGTSPRDSEYRAVNFLAECLRQRGVSYVLPMRFNAEVGDRTSYHLVLASKNFRAYELMKEVMRKICTGRTETVVPFEFNVRVVAGPQQLELLPDPAPEDDLAGRLFRRFAGRSLAFRSLYRSFESENTTPFLKRDYVAAIDELRDQGLVSGGRRGGIGDDIEVRFGTEEDRRPTWNRSEQPSQQALF